MRLIRMWGGGMLAALAATASLAACNTTGQVPVAVSPAPIEAAATVQGDGVVLTGARAFAAAELAYITAADAAGRLADVGFIRGTAATRLRAINAQARRALVAGKSATNAAAQAQAAASLFGFTDQLDLLAGRK